MRRPRDIRGLLGVDAHDGNEGIHFRACGEIWLPSSNERSRDVCENSFFLAACMLPSLSLAAVHNGAADPGSATGSGRTACEEKRWTPPCAEPSVSKRPMTEAEAKEIARQRFLREIAENHPSIRVEGIFAETADTFIIRGYIYSREARKEGAYFCAVHKMSGKCGIIVPLPGPEPTKESLKGFSWENWLVEL